MTFIIFFALLGIILVFLEILLPGAVLGILGGLFLLAAVVITFFKFGLLAGSATLLGLTVLTGVVILCGLQLLPRTAAGKKIFLTKNLSDAKTTSDFSEVLDREGTALTMLRPAGKAEIDGKRYDVVAESGFITTGSKIKVVMVEGFRIVVRQV